MCGCASEPEDLPHVQRSDGEGASAPMIGRRGLPPMQRSEGVGASGPPSRTICVQSGVRGDGASEPEDSSHVQRSDGECASEPETTNFTAVQRADGDIVCTFNQLQPIYCHHDSHVHWQDSLCARCQMSGELLSRITVVASVRAVPNCRYHYDAKHMSTCKVPDVVSYVVVDMYSTHIRHRLDIDSTYTQ